MRQKLNLGISIIIIMLTIKFLIMANLGAADKLKIVTSTTDLASIAQEVGGEYVEVFSIAEGYQDPHFVDAKPSYIMKLQEADMFIQVGLGLEIGWVPPLLDGSRNADILPGAKGYVDASAGIPLLQVPTGDPATLRAQGDIHASGNPHYWLDPLRGKIIAQNIFDKLISLRPANRPEFERNLERFNRKIDEKVADWQEKLKPYAGAKIVAFHNSWPYFEERFGLEIVTFIEPKPGIPPTPKYLVEVIKIMSEQNVKVIIISPYYSKKSSELVASKVGGEVVELASSVNGFPEVKDYFGLFDYNINKLIEAFRRNGY